MSDAPGPLHGPKVPWEMIEPLKRAAKGSLSWAVVLSRQESQRTWRHKPASSSVSYLRGGKLLLQERCQAHNALGVWARKDRFHYRWVKGQVPFIRRLLRAFASPRSHAGAPSAYTAGDWVTVRDRKQIESVLDRKLRTRNLTWVEQQWLFCGTVQRVLQVVTHIHDDSGFARPVSHTVLLEGVNCDAPTGRAGCGRACPMFFRDEWLETASPPIIQNANAGTPQFARVRSVEEINATLDVGGGCNGLKFMPEMYGYAGLRVRIEKKITLAHEGARDRTPRADFYLLKGLRCSGAIVDHIGGCQRACPLLWHASWLSIEAPSRTLISGAEIPVEAGRPTRANLMNTRELLTID